MIAHSAIVSVMETMALKCEQFCQWDFLHLFCVRFRAAACLKQLIEAGRLDFTDYTATIGIPKQFEDFP